jgi:hypothetical protein
MPPEEEVAIDEHEGQSLASSSRKRSGICLVRSFASPR